MTDRLGQKHPDPYYRLNGEAQIRGSWRLIGAIAHVYQEVGAPVLTVVDGTVPGGAEFKAPASARYVVVPDRPCTLLLLEGSIVSGAVPVQTTAIAFSGNRSLIANYPLSTECTSPVADGFLCWPSAIIGRGVKAPTVQGVAGYTVGVVIPAPANAALDGLYILFSAAKPCGNGTSFPLTSLALALTLTDGRVVAFRELSALSGADVLWLCARGSIASVGWYFTDAEAAAPVTAPDTYEYMVLNLTVYTGRCGRQSATASQLSAPPGLVPAGLPGWMLYENGGRNGS